jgi:hypothetical protein
MILFESRIAQTRNSRCVRWLCLLRDVHGSQMLKVRSLIKRGKEKLEESICIISLDQSPHPR